MSKTLKAVGSELNKGLNRLNYTNPLIWGVIPGAVTATIIFILIAAVFQVPVTGESEVNMCKTVGTERECEDKIISNRYNILWYIFAPLIGGLIVGGLILQLGFVINNPKTGAAIIGAGMMRKAITGR